MAVIGRDDVVAAKGGVLHVAAGDLVTPLARELAGELGVTIVAGGAAGPDTTGTAAGPAKPGSAGEPPPLTGPPSAALYRRAAPTVPPEMRPERVVGAPPRVSGSPGRNKSAPTTPKSIGGRVTVVGAGHVGATTAMRLAEADVFSEVVMVDVVPGLAAGLALDLWHSASLRRSATRLRGAVDLADGAGSDFVVVTAGRARQPGMSRSDLTAANAAIVSAVAEQIRAHSPDAIVVVVTNPLDEMTYLAREVTGFPAQRVLGMAGVLDSVRFCALTALATGARPDEVSALALGSHGEEMVIPLSQARLGDRPIAERVDAASLAALVDRARNSGAEVVKLLEKGSAYYAPAASTAEMVLAMARDTKAVLPCCVLADGTYGIRDVYLGLPARLGRTGVEAVVDVGLTDGELADLAVAAGRIAERVKEL